MKILGFDLGDGESAVTLLDEDSTVEPRVLPLCGRNSLLSAVGVKNGRIVIGEEASVTDGAAEAKGALQVALPDRSLRVGGCARVCAGRDERVDAHAARADGRGQPNGGRLSGGLGRRRREQYAALLESAGFPTSASCRSRAPRFSMRATRAACASARS